MATSFPSFILDDYLFDPPSSTISSLPLSVAPLINSYLLLSVERVRIMSAADTLFYVDDKKPNNVNKMIGEKWGSPSIVLLSSVDQ